ncbi:MAG: amidase family protein [Acidobacteria bacterium]|nr:amidase family protein [Acidobacteriota bacterium]
MKVSLSKLFSSRLSRSTALLAFLSLSLWSCGSETVSGPAEPFELLEATIEDIHNAYQSGQLTARQLVQLYLDRIEAYDRNGPLINSIINVNPQALEEAEKLDAAFQSSGLVGPLHGIPVILKDQIDAAGVQTTMGSVIFRDYIPDSDAFAIAKLKAAGAIVLAKATLGELGGGDTHGSLFGTTRNPYALDRTVGGSSGGPGGAIAANFATVAVGQEGFASIRRPSTFNSLVGMRPSAGLVSRSGVWNGWPTLNGSMGPMARTVRDAATVLEILVGYDPEDPITARGYGKIPESYTAFLDEDGLRGARIGVLRESFGSNAEPGSEDFLKVKEVFDQAVEDLKAAGAELVDPVVIPDLKELLGRRSGAPSGGPEGLDPFQVYFARSSNPPFKSREEAVQSPDFEKMFPSAQRRLAGGTPDPEAQARAESRNYQSLVAANRLMMNLLKVMADHQLDAIVHNSIEHTPAMIGDGTNPPYPGSRGAPNLNTFLLYVPTITVPAGFTSDNLPTGISFLGRPYTEGTMIKLAYSYEQATMHRRPPESTPPLPRD